MRDTNTVPLVSLRVLANECGMHLNGADVIFRAQWDRAANAVGMRTLLDTARDLLRPSPGEVETKNRAILGCGPGWLMAYMALHLAESGSVEVLSSEDGKPIISGLHGCCELRSWRDPGILMGSGDQLAGYVHSDVSRVLPAWSRIIFRITNCAVPPALLLREVKRIEDSVIISLHSFDPDSMWDAMLLCMVAVAYAQRGERAIAVQMSNTEAVVVRAGGPHKVGTRVTLLTG